MQGSVEDLKRRVEGSGGSKRAAPRTVLCCTPRPAATGPTCSCSRSPPGSISRGGPVGAARARRARARCSRRRAPRWSSARWRCLRRGLLSPRAGCSTCAGRLRGTTGGSLGRLAHERDAALVHSNTSVRARRRRRRPPPRPARARDLRRRARARSGRSGAGGCCSADALACVSAAVAEQFERRAEAWCARRARREPEPAARDAARAELGLPADGFVVALLGRISDWKGQDVLARARWPQLERHRRDRAGRRGRVARPGAPRRELEAARHRLGGRLRLLGFRDDVDTILGAADAVAVPSKRPDPFPNSALEAAAAGLPVVAAAHGGLPRDRPRRRHRATRAARRPRRPGRGPAATGRRPGLRRGLRRGRGRATRASASAASGCRPSSRRAYERLSR